VDWQRNLCDRKEIHGVISGLMATTGRDRCNTGIYLRAKANVESLLSLRYAKDFQAIAMITRSLFELTVDMKLTGIITDAVLKIATSSEVERLAHRVGGRR
jgi:hypothetical protein